MRVDVLSVALLMVSGAFYIANLSVTPARHLLRARQIENATNSRHLRGEARLRRDPYRSGGELRRRTCETPITRDRLLELAFQGAEGAERASIEAEMRHATRRSNVKVVRLVWIFKYILIERVVVFFVYSFLLLVITRKHQVRVGR